MLLAQLRDNKALWKREGLIGYPGWLPQGSKGYMEQLRINKIKESSFFFLYHDVSFKLIRTDATLDLSQKTHLFYFMLVADGDMYCFGG